MERVDFLREALPPGTRYSLRIIKKQEDADPLRKNLFFTDFEGMADSAAHYSSEGWNVYYATAGFGAGSKADGDNAVAKRELYIDVDCGPTKPYATKADGLSALKDFVQKMGLPRPTLVDSGNGIHAHWFFEAPVPVHDWHSVALSLKQHCLDHDFKVDGACTADTVRVLRVPGTINTKGGQEVRLLTPLKHHAFDKLRGILGVTQSDPFKNVKERNRAAGRTAPSEVSKLISSNKTSKFETIWIKSVEGSGCAQINHAITEADTLPEPNWRAVLSVAQFCEDRDWAIHEISKGHPDYDPDETERKAALTKGPYTCETFQGLDTAHLCAGCAHAGKITSPIQLGSEVKEAAPEDNVVVVDEITYEIPTYPWPFFRGHNGGIYMRSKPEDGDKDDDNKEVHKVVYPYDLYAYHRMRDPMLGDVVWIRHHMPNDGVREFSVPQRDISALDRLRDKLSEQGVTIVAGKQINNLQHLLSKQIQELQAQNKADKMHAKFGWTDNRTFIVGNREYTKEGVRLTPVARSIEQYIHWFTPKGTLEEWKTVAAAYEHEAFDLHAFGVLAGFGSVLMALSPERGGVLNFYSKASGTGKTTILKMANSIFGDPRAMMKDAQDTPMSKTHRMGVLNGIITCLDEMTNVPPQEASTLLYGCTQGRARDRMRAGENMERVNEMTWNGMSLWSSNTSMEDRLSLIKMDPQGEMARTVEIHLSTPVPADVLESQKIFTKLNHNYGHAADVFLRYVIPNLEEVEVLWAKVRDKIYAIRKWTQTERYRLNLVICNITAGLITNKLGLTNYNIKRILKKICDQVHKEGVAMREMSTTALETFAAFVNANISNMLVIDNNTKDNGLQNKEYREPKGRLIIRHEPDTDRLYIVQRDFNRWCAEMFINAKEMQDLFKSETGIPLNVIKKRMGKGWDADFGSVAAYEIMNVKRLLGMTAGPRKDGSE